MTKNKKELRLDLNEGQQNLISKKLAANLISQGDWHRYSRKTDIANLKNKTAKRLGVKGEQIVFFNGTYHALDTLFNFLVNDGENIILPVPTFAFYPKFEKYRRVVFKKIKYSENLSLPVTRILTALDSKTRLIYIVNPNNPLGSIATNNELEIIVRAACSKNAYVIIDEVYSEFLAESVISLIAKYKNLIVLRSFSKIGLSGLKLGLTVSNEKLAQKIEDMRGDIYNVNKASISIIDRVFSRSEQISKYTEDIVTAKTQLISFLKDRKVAVLPSYTNFVTAKFYHHQELVERLKQKNILVKDLSHYPDISRWLNGYIRITVPQTKDLPFLLKVLGTTMDQFKKNS
jgi:histidinol-phosphate aminotransferase